MTTIRRASYGLLLAATIGLAACSGGGGGGGNNGGGDNNGGNPTPTATLTVAPNQVAFEAQQTVQFTPTTTNVTAPVFTYEVVPPVAMQTRALSAEEIAARFGSIDGNGLFTAGAEVVAGDRGSVVVRETSRALAVTVPIMVVPPIQTVVVTPSEAAVLAGGSATFTATAVDFFNEPVTDFLVDWRVNGSVGRITAAGLFTGTTAGTGLVEARIGLAQPGTATVTVVGSVVGLTITPAGNPVEVEAGTARQFHAAVRDASGNSTEVTAAWSLQPDSLGTINANGLFTAGAVGGEGTVTATAQGQTATLPVRIVELLAPPTALPGNVAGNVRNSTGALLPGATVVATLASDGSEVARATTNSSGAYTLFLPVGTFNLTATHGASTGARAGVVVPVQDYRQQADLTVTP